ncbi:alkyl sulfatase C-terminal domain-containing protein [Streptomyces monticola]|uniref:Alkyl sulfatase C-terminal domain-containing protein n=1 Tax=Streptomyces monticola TaxID=2666263 RepID=A0ABW2JQB3_9ACTN
MTGGERAQADGPAWDDERDFADADRGFITRPDALLGRSTTLEAELAAGALHASGDLQALTFFGTLLDEPDTAFAIVTP